jgi:hypothetical protein
MKIKSTLLAQASGALGGFVASHNRGGMYLRSRSIPTNPGTTEQNRVRTAFGALADMFQSLDSAERQSWEDYAENVLLTDRLGEPRKATALNMFEKCNAVRYGYLGYAYVTRTAPSTYNVGATPQIQSLTATYFAVNSLKVTTITSVSDAPPVTIPYDMIIFDVSAPQPKSINSFKGPFHNMTQEWLTQLDTQPQTHINYPSGNWAVLGGDKVFIRARVSRADGRLSGATIVSAITGPHP